MPINLKRESEASNMHTIVSIGNPSATGDSTPCSTIRRFEHRYRQDGDAWARRLVSRLLMVSLLMIAAPLSAAPTLQEVLWRRHSAYNLAGIGGNRSALTVQFWMRNTGPSHVAGIRYTTDGWANWSNANARYLLTSGVWELWEASVTLPGHGRKFEYVCWANDHRGFDTIVERYDTNDGETFYIKTTAWSLVWSTDPTQD